MTTPLNDGLVAVNQGGSVAPKAPLNDSSVSRVAHAICRARTVGPHVDHECCRFYEDHAEAALEAITIAAESERDDLKAGVRWLEAAGDRLAEALAAVVAYANEVGYVAEVLYLRELEDWEELRRGPVLP